jgi:hypothetical protein
VKEEDEEYVLPPHDMGEVKKDEEDVEKDDHNHPHQSMGYWMSRRTRRRVVTIIKSSPRF